MRLSQYKRSKRDSVRLASRYRRRLRADDRLRSVAIVIQKPTPTIERALAVLSILGPPPKPKRVRRASPKPVETVTGRSSAVAPEPEQPPKKVRSPRVML